MSEDHLSEFLLFRDQLRSFLFRLLTSLQDVEDVMQTTYLKVHDNIDSFKKDSSFKTWVFSIAYNTAKNHLARQKRWDERAQDYGAEINRPPSEYWDKFEQVFQTTPDKQYETKEHIAYCFNCIVKTLVLEQQVCLWLKEVYQFKISEILEITQLTEGKVKHAIANARKHMNRIFDERCALVNKKGHCTQCTTLTSILNHKQKEHIEKARNKYLKYEESNNQEHLLNVRMKLTQSIDPLNSPNTLMNMFMLKSLETWTAEGKKKNILKNPSEKVF
ncbi:RNA polymerase sigma factor [Flagellimonas sp. S174]|uniref:RNA polymerase sigma factor n=1 Tax=Flagellimonas sp. S174 TaxID=3410790 RepID=UPI003BF52402